MSFSNQDAINELGYKNRIITGNMYAAMASIMPAGDYKSPIISCSAIYQLSTLLAIPQV